ncbi:MAG: hypothetical protein Q7S48_03900 [bacterium]|nr:hypothetical protein [bacterium]
MKQEREIEISGRQESRLWRRFAKIVLAVVFKPGLREEVELWTQDFLSQHDPEVLKTEAAEQEERQGPERDFAEERQVAMQAFYASIGITVVVPKPSIASNREYRRIGKGKKLFYRPATSTMAYAAFMTAVGQGQHWTVTHEDRNRIKWEEAAKGYWFWAEVALRCSRVKTPWKTLIKKLKRLISLEEYVIVWHMCHKVGETLDISDWCWTRTRYNFANAGEKERLGALDVDGYDGEVDIRRASPERLELAYDSGGGLSAEVVQAVT